MSFVLPIESVITQLGYSTSNSLIRSAQFHEAALPTHTKRFF